MQAAFGDGLGACPGPRRSPTSLMRPSQVLGLSWPDKHSRGTSALYFSSPSCEDAKTLRFVVGSPGEARGRACRTRGKQSQPREMKNTLAGVKGRGCRDTVLSFKCFRHLCQKGEIALCRASLVVRFRLLQQNASSFSIQVLHG